MTEHDCPECGEHFSTCVCDDPTEGRTIWNSDGSEPCLICPPPEPTYRIIRFHQSEPTRTVAEGLSLEEAQAHCSREDTHGADWFDGYTAED